MAFDVYTTQIHTCICKECRASKQSTSVDALSAFMERHVCGQP